VGDDYPGTPKTWRMGDRTWYELQELQTCGLSPMECIVAATRTNAEAYQLEDIGTLEAGKRADVILVNGDPLADLAIPYQPENILLVIKDGSVEFADGDYLKHYRLREDL